jgi:hypothetical protein
MWNGYCGNLIRRASRNTLLAGLILLVFAACVAAANQRYLRSFFLGARPSSVEAVAQMDLAHADQFVKLTVPAAYSTGITHTTTYREHPRGYVDSVYLLAADRGRPVVLRVPAGEAPAKAGPLALEGRLRPLEGELEEQIKRMLAGSQVPLPVAALYLDAEDYRSMGWIEVCLGVPLIAFALFLLWRAWQWSADPASHPLARSLSAQTAPLEIALQQMDQELTAPHPSFRLRGTRLEVSEHWLLAATPFSARVLALDRLAWAYRHVVRRKLYLLITISRWNYLQAFAAGGRRFTVRLREKDVNAALEELARRAPGAVFGYSRELAKLWKRDRERFREAAAAAGLAADPRAEKVSSSLYRA